MKKNIVKIVLGAALIVVALWLVATPTDMTAKYLGAGLLIMIGLLIVLPIMFPEIGD